MVARDPSSGRPEQGFLGRAFSAWRRFLARLVRGGADTATSIASTVSADLEEARHEGVPALRGRTIVWAGWGAAVVGSLGAIALAPAGEVLAATVAAALGLGWAGVRLWLLRFADPLPRDPKGVRGAWALGLCAYILAVTPELGVAAFLVSGTATGVALVRVGADRPMARRAVLFAWGAQAAVMLLAWVARTAYVLLYLGG